MEIFKGQIEKRKERQRVDTALNEAIQEAHDIYDSVGCPQCVTVPEEPDEIQKINGKVVIGKHGIIIGEKGTKI